MDDFFKINELIFQGNLPEALDLVRERATLTQDWVYTTKELEILREMGNLDEALNKLRKLERLPELTFLEKFDLDLEKLYCFLANFEIETAVEYSRILYGSLEELHTFSKDDILGREAKFYHLQGNIHTERGQYNDALESTEKALDFYTQVGFTERIALMLNNYGFMQSLMGHTKSAEATLQRGLDLYEETGKKQDKARILNNLGIVKTQQEQFDEAEQYFQLGLKLQKEVNNPLEISYSLLELIKLRVLTNKDPTTVLEELRQLSFASKETIIRLRFQLGKAMVMKSIPRFKSKVEAQQLLEDIAWDSRVPQRYSLIALKHLAEIKFDELQTYGDETVLDEIQELIDLQLRLSKSQMSIIAEIETKLLESKLLLLRGKIDESIQSIENCLSLAKENELYYLAKLSSDFLNQLASQLEYWKDKTPLMNLEQRLEKVEIFSFLRNIQFDNMGYLTIDKEIPVLFLVMTQAGSVKLNIRFQELDEINEHMIGTFISAINSFFSEAFVSSNSIERINSNDYTLLLKPEYGLTYCYIFKGQSYYAARKLRNVITELKMMPDYQNFILDKGISLPISLELAPENIEKLAQLMNE